MQQYFNVYSLDTKVYLMLPLCKLALSLHSTTWRDKQPVMYLQLSHNDGKTVERNSINHDK